LHPTADLSNSKRKLNELISALICEAIPFLSSRKQEDAGSGSIIQSLFLRSIVCRQHRVRLARRSLEINLSPVRCWSPPLGIGLQCSWTYLDQSI